VTVTDPAGFRASGVTAGLKPSGQPDIALVVNDGPEDVAAAVFTSNRCRANPVVWSERVLETGSARTVVLNSGGGANCYTGSRGYENTRATAERVARELGTNTRDVVVCSTGMIGTQLPSEDVLAGVTQAVPSLSDDGGSAAAEAILTTDTHSKQVLRSASGFRVGGMAKGAGMLAPAMATMLVVLTTDAAVDSATADAAVREASRRTFERLDSDGCLSTNDTVLLMCSGASGVPATTEQLTSVLTEACQDLTMQLLADAEGSEHDIGIEVANAVTEQQALEVGRAVARSNLFKCAVFGRDPNWGRILASVGTTSAEFDPTRLDVVFNGVRVCRDGVAADSPENVDLSDRRVDITIDLRAGAETATIWTNDLTHAYVEENSAYST